MITSASSLAPALDVLVRVVAYFVVGFALIPAFPPLWRWWFREWHEPPSPMRVHFGVAVLAWPIWLVPHLFAFAVMGSISILGWVAERVIGGQSTSEAIVEATDNRVCGDGTYLCLCHQEIKNDAQGLIRVMNPACPIHGPAGRGRWFDEVTTVSDGGLRRYVDAGPCAGDEE